MASRIRGPPSHVFDCFMEISRPTEATGNKPLILQRFPHNFKDEEITKSVPQFCYPCVFQSQNVLHFSFVLTSIDSKWSFGFIRHPPSPGQTCLVILSSLPWHDTFYKLLNYIATLISKDQTTHLNRFLEALYSSPVPQPGLLMQVVYFVDGYELEFSAQCPDHHKIPSIPEDRNLSEYFSAIDSNNMIMIFASILNERRILIKSSKLSRLSACVQAANSLIYPMYWQHIFIPVLPSHLLEYLSAPMPFLIGVPTSTLQTLKHPELGEVVVLDADEDKISSPFDDMSVLPNEIISFLKRNLRSQGSTIGDGVARTFLKALVMLIGGYRDALRFNPREKITFDRDAFIKTRPLHMQHFLQKMLHLQIFHQFIEDRLRMLNEGEGFSDEFEFELNMYEDRNTHRLRTQYREWLGAMKKEGGALLKSMNPAVKSAYKQVKHRGKQVKDKSKRAYQDLRLKFQDTSGIKDLPRSAPSSPRASPTIYSSSSHIPHVKKSSSGMIYYKQSRSAVFPTDSVENKRERNFSGDSFKHTPLVSDNGRSSEQAPEASSEDSEVDSAGENALENIFTEKVNIDIVSELQQVMDVYKSRLKKENTSDPQSSMVKPPTSPIRRPFAPAFLPPPRPPKNKPRPESKSEELLIKLDSSPDEIETLFDPLKSSSSKNNGSSSFLHSPTSIFSKENPYSCNNFSSPNIASPSSSSNLALKGLSHNSSNLKSSNHLPSEFDGFKGRPSFLHNHLFQSDSKNSAFHPPLNQPINISTNPFTDNSEQPFKIISCDNLDSVSRNTSTESNPFASNWQKFD